MSFTYNVVYTRSSDQIQWFSEANPSARENVLNFVKAATGYISGNWRVNPTNSNQYLITHEWASKADWQAMSTALGQTEFGLTSILYHQENNFTKEVTLSE
jgi:hypothetical protein